MKKFLTIPLFILITCQILFAQNDEKTWFDFWVGSWEVTWAEADGKTGRGKNIVTKTLDNVVIQENFSIIEGASKGYQGTSISVYNTNEKLWHQAYADNRGAYFDFVGASDGDKRIFNSKVVQSGDKEIMQRMVFYDIKKDSLGWDWERSEDGGKTWTLNWRINYKRAGT